MKEFTPHIEPLSIDEAFLEVSGMSTMYSGPKHWAEPLKIEYLRKLVLLSLQG